MDRLEKYGEKLESYGNRLTSLEMGQRHLADVFDLAERRIMGVVADLKEIVESGFESLDKRFASLDKQIFTGNGKPSLEQRIARIELWQSREEGADAQRKSFWDHLRPILPWFLLVANAAALYFIKVATSK